MEEHRTWQLGAKERPDVSHEVKEQGSISRSILSPSLPENSSNRMIDVA